METFEFLVGDKKLSFELTAQSDDPVWFCLGIRKSGSTMLNRIVASLANQNSINVVDLPGAAFQSGLTMADWATADLGELLRNGNLYTGFRAFPSGLAAAEGFSTGKKVFMFRDPRDALVSQYFSDAYSHSLPAEGSSGRDKFLQKREEALATEIDDYVLAKAASMRATFRDYVPLLNDPTCLCLRYEDYIFQKKKMIHKILNHYGWPLRPKGIEAILKRFDIVPETEDKTRFIRKGVPGDHRAKLSLATIDALDEQLSDVLKPYDYV